MTDEYVELHAASAFSFLEAASHPEDLITRAAELNMPAMALLDRNGLYGAARFHTAAARAGIAAQIGAEVSTAALGMRLRTAAWLPAQHPIEPVRLPLLCTSRTGYQNLCQLISAYKLREISKTEGSASLDELQQYAEGLVCLTGGDEGPLASALTHGGEAAGRTLQRADTVGMFQVESRAQMSALPQNHPTRFYDVVVQVAIIRPGPIVGKMMHPYMQRRQNLETITYPHRSLEPVLKRTLGMPLFQEQLLRMAMVVANFSGAEDEELRRAVGMRRSWERMKNLEGRLRAGMSTNGIDEETQQRIIDDISSFALYGFPESHAASFALIAYASAYLKVKYLAAFTCALLNNQPMGFYSPAVLVMDARRHGLRVKPIDIQLSSWPCTLEHEPDASLSMRLGLGYARGLRLVAHTSGLHAAVLHNRDIAASLA